MKIAIAIILSALLWESYAFAAETPNAENSKNAQEKKEVKARPQTKCPVMGGPINKSLYVDAQGKRIYVCCKGCLEALKKEPGKYIKVMEAEGIVLDKAR